MARLLSVFLLAVTLLLSNTDDAKAVTIDILGINYEILLTPTGTSFLDFQTEIMASPWWGNPGVAATAAGDFLTATGGDFGLTAGTSDAVFFAHTHTAATVFLRLIVESGSAIDTSTGEAALSATTVAYAYAVAVPSVPEVDGNALAQMLMVLFVGYLLLRVRRRVV